MPTSTRLLSLLLLITLTACGGGGGGGGSPAPAAPPPVAVAPDADKDGVPDANDVAPNDALCAAASDAEGGVCYLRTLATVPLKIIGNDGGRLVFLVEGSSELYHYDLTTRHFLGKGKVSGYTARYFAYSADHKRLYASDADNRIHSYNENMQESATVFATLTGTVNGLQSAGKYVVAQDDSGAWETHTVFDRQGVVTDAKEWNYYSQHYAWSKADSRLYYFRDGVSPNDLMYEVVDQATGKITSMGESPYHGSYNILGPIRVSPAGDKVLLGSGDVYLAPALTWSGNIGATVTQAEWLANGQLVTWGDSGTGAKLVRYENGVRVEELQVDGRILGMVINGNSNQLILKKADQIGFVAYVPSDDSDGDGVANTVDRFPLDKTAAVDSDNDGYPDAFLGSYTAADSPTGLKLDAYPNDPNCYLAADGNGSVCNLSSAPPMYVPDYVLNDEGGNVYLVSFETRRIYRWSAARNSYLTPIAFTPGAGSGAGIPTQAKYVASHDRIYFGYGSGLITYVNVNGDTRETRLAATAMAVRGLAAAGNFLVAQDGSGAWATHYVFDRDGTLRDSKEWNAYSTDYDWNPAQQRLYFFRDDTSPNDVMYETIDQASGKIGAAGDSPYHGDYPIAAPVRVSAGGTRLYTGSGIVYNLADLTMFKNLAASATDAQWLPNGSLVTVVANGAGAQVRVYNSVLSIVKETTYPGKPLRLVRIGSQVILVTQEGDAPRFTVVAP
jgi:hypothetical protein